MVRSGFVKTEGDELYYEVRGEGEPLLMITGGGGDAGFYTYVADILADEYQVITYDRRGNSRSTRNEPQNFEVSQQARDAVAVLEAVGHPSAYVFGNSGGAVFALELAARHPQAVKAMVVHEPPVVRLLPDAAKWQRFFANVYRTSFRFGVQAASFRFNLSLSIPFSAFKTIPKDYQQRATEANNEYFLIRHEMIPSINYMPDIEKIKQNRVNIVVAAGKMTLDKRKYYGRTVPILAEKLGCEMATFPGHHISFFDMPREWASVLRDLLHRI
ncbi:MULTISPECIES: alpha/beta fold hydrolase [Paenibacillus]|uniref:Alpha/beta hydrolase n=1 Tax=Paenibacillus albilobatus TaxID=2716884 RepID=A0A919XE32_9BACL|nr:MULTISPECIES: alpha/beta hydrolase [Paenibacillus]GIO29310.1 alpha/beta hydrolase [Paenibacillus albilobatus]